MRGRYRVCSSLTTGPVSPKEGRELTFVIDTPTLMMFGLGMALMLRGHELGSPFGKRVTACALAFNLIGGIVIPSLFYLKAPDWMWMYFVDDSQLPGWLGWYVLLNYWFPFLAAYFLGAYLWRHGRNAVIGAFVVAAISQVVIIAMTFDRYFHVGTTAQYLAGEAVPLPKSHLSLALNLGAVAWAVLGVSTFLYLRKEHRKATTAG